MSANDLILGKHIESVASAAKNYCDNLAKTATDEEIDTLLDNIFGGNIPAPVDDYSQYLIVDSPFSEDFTDKCGKTWEIGGNPVIQDGKLYLDGSSYLSLPDITLGSQSFTIQFYLHVLATTATGGRAFAFNDFELYRTSNSNNRLNLKATTSFGSKAFDETIGWKNNIYFAAVGQNVKVTISHFINDDTIAVFFNETPISSFNTVTNRVTNTFYLSKSNQPMIGYISDFKIYDGVALYPD